MPDKPTFPKPNKPFCEEVQKEIEEYESKNPNKRVVEYVG